MARKGRSRQEQVTCTCGAYEFPHRKGGGQCSSAKCDMCYDGVCTIHGMKDGVYLQTKRDDNPALTTYERNEGRIG